MNVIERAMLICKGEEITLKDLPSVFQQQRKTLQQETDGGLLVPDSWLGKILPQVREEVMDEVERLYWEMVLQKARGRVGDAAARAGIHSRTLYNKMKRLGLKRGI